MPGRRPDHSLNIADDVSYVTHLCDLQAQGRDSTDLLDGAAYVKSMPDLRKPVFDETYDSNEVPYHTTQPL